VIFIAAWYGTGRVLGPRRGVLKIYIGDKVRAEGVVVPFAKAQEFQDSLTKLLPTVNWVPVNIERGDNQATMSVIVRNITPQAFKNGRLGIISTSYIHGMTAGAKVFSPNQIYYDISEFRPFGKLGTESFNSIQVSTPDAVSRVGFCITVEADDVEPSAVFVGLEFRKN
jgi:hypothetical protein